ncbi:hypothetical protein ACTXT7_015129 [Hymenolepis weldensis]
MSPLVLELPQQPQANPLLLPFQISTKGDGNSRLEALLNTARRLILGVRSHRDMTCEGLAQRIPPGNPEVRHQRRWYRLSGKSPTQGNLSNSGEARSYQLHANTRRKEGDPLALSTGPLLVPLAAIKKGFSAQFRVLKSCKRQGWFRRHIRMSSSMLTLDLVQASSKDRLKEY